MKKNLVICFLLFLNSFLIANNSFFVKDTLRSKVEQLVVKLDSISKGKNNIVNLNVESEQFQLFLSIFKIASQNELLYLIENHPNQNIKGYAYIGLVVSENKNADILMKRYFKNRITFWENETGHTADSSELIIKFIHSKKIILQKVILNTK